MSEQPNPEAPEWEYADVPPGTEGACWPIDPACEAEFFEGLPDHVKTRAQVLAVSTLRALTAYRVGGCPVTIRPCSRSCAEDYGTFLGDVFRPHINLQGRWVNGCGCRRNCHCGNLESIPLTGPVGDIVEIKVDGVVLDPSQYLLIDGKDLALVDRQWPACQDLTAPDTEPGTASVTYYDTIMPDSSAAWAAGVLTYEFALACSGNQKCALPRGVTSITRQGISMEIPSGAFPDGLTGIRTVDAFVNRYNPNRLKTQPSVWSPDKRSHPRVRTFQ